MVQRSAKRCASSQISTSRGGSGGVTKLLKQVKLSLNLPVPVSDVLLDGAVEGSTATGLTGDRAGD